MKRKRHDTPTLVASHPFGVRPGGNILGSEQNLKQKKLGRFFGALPDSVLVAVLDEVEQPRDLLTLSHVCKAMYAFASFDEFWKRMVYAEGGKVTRWMGSWKETFWQHSMRPYIDCSGTVYSDFLYRPFQCSQVDYSELIVGKEGNIKVMDEKDITTEQFDDKWHNMPFVVNLERPSADWTLDDLVTKYGDVLFRQEYMTWPLNVYHEYMRENTDESPLYLFDCSSSAMSELEYSVPLSDIFGESRDYFELLQKTRPEHRWLIVGPKNSGSTFHKDPNGTSAWNTVISGTKYWVMFPPGHPPPGVSTDEDESEVIAPVSAAEWFLSGYYEQARREKHFRDGWTRPGQAMYVPSGWWHLVVNVTGPNVALTGNFVPQPKLAHVLNFLKNKRDQISGFACGGENSVYEQFVDKLTETSPEVAQRALAEVRQLEEKKHAPSKWDQLTAAKSSLFSFGF